MALGDFPIDPTVKGVRRNPTVVPDGHPRRCQAKRHPNWGGGQCKRWALKKHFYCPWHQKKYKRSDMSGTPEYIYHKRASVKLKKLLEEANSQPMEDLQGEIDVSRVMSSRAVELMDKVLHSEKEISHGATLNLIEFTQKALKCVSELIEKQVKINALNSLSPEQVEFVNAQIIKILRRYLLPEQEDVYITIVDAFETIKVPTRDIKICID